MTVVNPLPVVTPQMQTQAKSQISKAKAALILEQPFFASLLINLPMIEDLNIPTMATNGKVYKYNPAFVMSMDLDETKFVLCHEVGHCILQHMYRRGERNHKKWNIAGDYVINDMLVRDKIGKMPPMGLYDPMLVQQGNNTTDGVYDLLPEPPDDGSGPGDEGNPMDDCEDAPGGEAEVAADQADMKVKIAQAAQAAKMCGKLTADQARMAELAIKPKVDYADVMRRFVSARAKVDISYSKPKRKYLSQDIYLPGMTGLKLGVVAVFNDCSGSISAAQLGEFGREITALHQDCKPEQTVVGYFDDGVSHVDFYDPDDEVKVTMHGGGGTAFSPIWKKIDELGLEPVACIVLTDLCCDDFGTDPGYPVLWVSTCEGQAPFGEVVLMNPQG